MGEKDKGIREAEDKEGSIEEDGLEKEGRKKRREGEKGRENGEGK